VIFGIGCYALLQLLQSLRTANMGNVALAIALLILEWLRDNWFQSLAVLFMLRVWIGLSALTGFAERLYMTICNDDVAVLLRAVSEARRGKATT